MSRRRAAAQSRGVVAVDEQAAARRRATTVGQPADGGGHDGRAGGLGLDGDQPEGLVVGRHGDQRSRRRTSRASSAWATGGTKRTTSSMPSSAGQLGERLGVLEAAAGRAADDRHDEARAQRRVAVEQHRDGPQQHVGRLERLDAADEQQHDRVRGQAERAARASRSVLGLEDRRGRRPGGRPRPGRGRRRRGRSAAWPRGRCWRSAGRRPRRPAPRRSRRASGSGVSPLGERGVLDLGHRVHRVHERHAPAVAGERADLAGEPVVGVHEVVVAQRRGRPRRAAPRGRRRTAGRAAPPWSGPRRGRRRRGARRRRRGLDDRRQRGGGGAGEDVDLDAARRAGGRARGRRRSCRPRRRCPGWSSGEVCRLIIATRSTRRPSSGCTVATRPRRRGANRHNTDEGVSDSRPAPTRRRSPTRANDHRRRPPRRPATGRSRAPARTTSKAG